MTESELAKELARRADLPHADAARILAVLGEVASEHVKGGLPSPVAGPYVAAPPAGAARAPAAGAPGDEQTPYVPGSREIDELIAAARQHPRGVEFLLDGDLGAVAITFQAHAFTVEAARHELRRQGT